MISIPDYSRFFSDISVVYQLINVKNFTIQKEIVFIVNHRSIAVKDWMV